MKLSILICTLPERQVMFDALKAKLMGQLFKLVEFKDQVEICSATSNKMTIGALRNDLLQMAKGDFIVFIDDDDEINDNYINAFMNAIMNNPNADCIGYRGYITFDGVSKKNWVISKECNSWHEKDGVYYRTPNHISPVKRTIAMQVKFPEIDFGEDYEYSMGILPFLKEEVFIDEQLYHYKFMAK
jgi:glycosyltransferase involved in cell wall biosynthesis